MRIASILSIIMVSLAVPAFADDEADLKKAGEQINAAYMEAFNKKDAAAMFAGFARNAIVVTTSGPQTDLTKLAETILKAGFDHVEVQTDQVWLLGPDIGIATGQSHYTGKNQSGAPVESSNFFAATLIKEDGKWKTRMLAGVPKRPPVK